VLKGLKGRALQKYAAARAVWTVDITAPTSDALTISSAQRWAKHSPLGRALYMYTSSIFKEYNFLGITVNRLKEGKLSRGQAAGRLAMAGVLIPATIYIKGKYTNMVTRALARKIAGKEGVWNEKKAADTMDDLFGIGLKIISQHPAAGITEQWVRSGYNWLRDRQVVSPGGLLLDRGITKVFADFVGALGEFAKDLDSRMTEPPYEGEREAYYDAFNIIAKGMSMASPFWGRMVAEAVPSKKYTTRFYYEMLVDGIKMGDHKRVIFAFDKLGTLGRNHAEISVSLRRRDPRLVVGLGEALAKR